jgi:hypothetical protein
MISSLLGTTLKSFTFSASLFLLLKVYFSLIVRTGRRVHDKINTVTSRKTNDAYLRYASKYFSRYLINTA